MEGCLPLPNSTLFMLAFVLDKLGSSLLAASKGLTLASSDSRLKSASISLALLQALFVEWLQEMRINPAALPVRVDVSTPALAAAVIEACLPLAEIMAMRTCDLVRKEMRRSQDGSGVCSHLWYNYGKINKYREAVKAMRREDLDVVRRLARRLPRLPSPLPPLLPRSGLPTGADRAPDRLTLRGALNLPEVTSSVFAAFFVRHAWKANRAAFHKELEDAFDVSSIPIDKLTIAHSTHPTEKAARQHLWERAFRSQQPPSVLEVHREFPSIWDRDRLADVTLVIPDGREVRVQELLSSLLPSNKRSSSSSIELPPTQLR